MAKITANNGKRKPDATRFRWIKFYIESLNDPKIVRLTDYEHRKWVNTLLVAGQHEDGIIPAFDDMAIHWRCNSEEAEKVYQRLVDLKLIVPTTGEITGHRGYAPHNWRNRQWHGASSTERSRRHRARKDGQLCNGNATQVKHERDKCSESESVSSVEQNTTVSVCRDVATFHPGRELDSSKGTYAGAGVRDVRKGVRS